MSLNHRGSSTCVRCCAVLQELCDLLSGLLHHDSAARMRVEDVMGADWFDGFDWQGLRDKTLAPPALEAVALPFLG